MGDLVMVMRVTIEPTTEFFQSGAVMVRLWRGTSASGAEVVVLVAAVGVAAIGVAPMAGPGQPADAVTDLLPGLVSIPPPDPVDAERWARAVLQAPRVAPANELLAGVSEARL